MSEIALIPIGMLPGIGLLILSTSTRYWTVVSDLLGMGALQNAAAGLEMRRATLFRDALVSLYVGVALAAASALAGSVLGFIDGKPGRGLAAVGAALAIGCVVFASVQLIRESLLSLRIVALHHGRQQNNALAQALRRSQRSPPPQPDDTQD